MSDEFDARMRENRYEPSGVELDELKRRAISQASRAERRSGRRSPRLVTAFLSLALMLTGGSAVLASTSGGSSGGPPSASVSQYQIVLGEKVVPGSAQLAAPTGCAAKAFNARVRGTQIVKVTFTLDGKKIKTLTKPNSGTFFQVRVNPAKLKIGVHRVVAVVVTETRTINQDTNTVTNRRNVTKTFRISFQRCARHLAAPRFTG